MDQLLLSVFNTLNNFQSIRWNFLTHTTIGYYYYLKHHEVYNLCQKQNKEKNI